MGISRERRRHRFDLNALQLLALLAIPGLFVPGWAWLGVFWIAVFIVPALRQMLTAFSSAPKPPTFEPPLPGPGQKLGMTGFLANVYLSQILMLINPFLVINLFGQILGQFWALARSLGRVIEADDYPSLVRYHLPFHGEWLVFNGGVTEATSHSWDLVTQRYAYDFVVADAALQRHTGNGEQVGDYRCYDREIVACAEGVVREVRDGVRDAPRVGTGWTDWQTRDIRGNYVVIEHAPREFSVSAHLRPGSVMVKVGDQVRRGQVIGRCGHTGNSTEPHLHFHLQDEVNFYTAMGLPVQFQDVIVDGRPQSDGVWLTRGERVQRGVG